MASLTIGSKSGLNNSTSGGGNTVNTENNSTINVVVPKRFTNSLGRPIDDESKHETSIETQKIHYL